METKSATIDRRADGTTFLNLRFGKKDHKITLTDDNPIEVKKIFNEILLELKKGEYAFALLDDKNDLYSHICREYISQLNAEIKSVYKEMENLNLVEEMSTPADSAKDA